MACGTPALSAQAWWRTAQRVERGQWAGGEAEHLWVHVSRLIQSALDLDSPRLGGWPTPDGDPHLLAICTRGAHRRSLRLTSVLAGKIRRHSSLVEQRWAWSSLHRSSWSRPLRRAVIRRAGWARHLSSHPAASAAAVRILLLRPYRRRAGWAKHRAEAQTIHRLLDFDGGLASSAIRAAAGVRSAGGD